MRTIERKHHRYIYDIAENNIITIISSDIQLRYLKEDQYVALCPFHDESTPSFFIKNNGVFHCFGCNLSGNLITFYKKFLNIDSTDEIYTYLVDRLSIELDTEDIEYSLSDLMHDAYIFYNKKYKENKEFIDNYLIDRGLTFKSINLVDICYTGNYSWSSLYNYLISLKKYEIDLILSSGIIIKNKNKVGYHDLFINRILWPIYNSNGTVVSFAGRRLDYNDDSDNLQPKYLNGYSNTLYSKISVQYGIHIAKKYIRLERYVIVVEGYTDIMALYEHGIYNAVALCGTALNNLIFAILSLFKEKDDYKIILMLDNDDAAHKSINNLIKNISTSKLNLIYTYVVKYPNNSTNMDVLDLHNTDYSLKEIIKDTEHIIDYLLRKKYIEHLDTIDSIETRYELFAYINKLIEYFPFYSQNEWLNKVESIFTTIPVPILAAGIFTQRYLNINKNFNLRHESILQSKKKGI